MGNPLIAQGVLNRLKASVIWTGFPQLNVTAPYLDKAGISLALEGESSVALPTMTGIVQSPEPYMMFSLIMNLLKTQRLSDQYKSQMETNSLIGDGIVRPDVSSGGLSPFPITNCSINAVRDLSLSGESAVYAVTIKGYYLVNSSLFD